jgi:hypothetical protein
MSPLRRKVGGEGLGPAAPDLLLRCGRGVILIVSAHSSPLSGHSCGSSTGNASTKQHIKNSAHADALSADSKHTQLRVPQSDLSTSHV